MTGTPRAGFTLRAWLAAILASALLFGARAATAEPVHMGVGFDYQGGPSGDHWYGPLAFALYAPERGDASTVLVRYHDDERGPGWAGAARVGIPVRGKFLARATGSRSIGDGDWRGWRVEAGPETAVGGFTLDLAYLATGDNDGARGTYVTGSVGRSMSASFYGEGGLAVGTSDRDSGVRGTVGGTWVRGSIAMYVQGSLGTLSIGDGTNGGAIGGQVSPGRSGNVRNLDTSLEESTLASSVQIGLRYVIH